MKFQMQSFAMCAPPGFDQATRSVGLLGLLGIFAVITFVEYFLTREFYRLGRRGFSWLLAVVASSIFSVGGCLLVWPAGAVAGAPLLVAFGIGKGIGPTNSRRTNEQEDPPPT